LAEPFHLGYLESNPSFQIDTTSISVFEAVHCLLGESEWASEISLKTGIDGEAPFQGPFRVVIQSARHENHLFNETIFQ
jgi:hypothetical protein